MSRKSPPALLSLAVSFVVVLAALVGPSASSAVTRSTSATTPRLWTCGQRAVKEPKSFTISCADGNIVLEATTWKTWGQDTATGAATFGVNFCRPNCVSSKMSYFEHATVTLSEPKASSHGELFSKLNVAYLKSRRKKTYSISFASLSVFKH